MRKILLFALFLSSLLWNAAAYAQERYLEVTLNEAGTLAEKAGPQLNSVRYLVINGPMNDNDFAVIRSACNNRDDGIKVLDLSGAAIVNNELPDNALELTSSLVEVILPEGLTRLGAHFLHQSNVRQINIPSTLTELGEGAFESSLISYKLTIPEGVKVIPNDAFYAMPCIYRITLKGAEEIGDNAFAENGKIQLICEKPIKKIGKKAFSYTGFADESMYRWNLSAVESIGEAAFEFSNANVLFGYENTGCALKEISDYLNVGNCNQSVLWICDGVQKIGMEAFAGNRNLKSLSYLSKDLEEIGKTAFRNTAIKELTLPAGISVIREGAFFDIPTLQEIYCPSAVPPVNENAFGGLTPNDIPVYIPVGTLEAYSKAPGWDYFTNFVELAEFPGQSGIEDAVADDADAVRVYAEGGCLRITGVEPGTRYTVYTVDGAMISSGIAEAPAALPAGAVYVVKVDGKGYKVKI